MKKVLNATEPARSVRASDQCGAVVCQSLGIGCLITLSGVLDSEELTRLAYPAPNVTAGQSPGATRE
jgi:hypothetical protein